MILNPLDDKYRWCVHCDADCWPEKPAHDADCPMVTGLYPVDLDMIDNGVVCGYCSEPFTDDDCYVEADITGNGPDTVCVIACIGCGASKSVGQG